MPALITTPDDRYASYRTIKGHWLPHCTCLSAEAHRRQASSHRYSTGLEHCGVPVGAGLPAMGPVRSARGSALDRADRQTTA
ncbi:hypothetical protein D0O09_10115 [Pseudomonas putida]|nr:hypothetical protein D0O09_10115 [Pseudomonas putida]